MQITTSALARNAAACASPHKIFTVPGAGHGLAYMLDPEGYHSAITELHFPDAEN